MPRDEINPKQERFLQEYLIDLNGTQAAIRAGYSAHTANEQASALLAKPNLKSRLKELSQSVASKLGIDAGYVLGGVKIVADITTLTGEWHNPQAAIKAYDLLGKHLKLWDNDDKKQQAITINIVQF